MKTLAEIQQKLKAPKNQYNAFGGFSYRSCEDILEAVKPLLGEATLTLSDEIVQIGERFYVKATASLCKDGEMMAVTAYAREEEAKKGMDAAQITGAASSYARKYALNGLFLIDDTRDADSATTKHGKAEKPQNTNNNERETIKHLKMILNKKMSRDFVPEERKSFYEYCLAPLGGIETVDSVQKMIDNYGTYAVAYAEEMKKKTNRK